MHLSREKLRFAVRGGIRSWFALTPATFRAVQLPRESWRSQSLFGNENPVAPPAASPTSAIRST